MTLFYGFTQSLITKELEDYKAKLVFYNVFHLPIPMKGLTILILQFVYCVKNLKKNNYNFLLISRKAFSFYVFFSIQPPACFSYLLKKKSFMNLLINSLSIIQM